ncbi:hypothetical protein ACW5XF_16910 [Aeromonas lusitana]|uniref:Uncharacterized protein n=1 Tax=Aeromonas lusitana TaxID=931529 RepID=A0A2M8HBB7_9GAMM|nr:hypothetical protein [Aeromonas lusitana]PJC93830.1 hypothetical protein CUC44_07705 [Aeromonas lusitana]
MDKPPSHRLVAGILALGLTSVLPSQTQACGYDMLVGDPFALAWPGTLDIAIATAGAISAKTIDPIPALTGGEGFVRAQQWLLQLKDQLQRADQPGGFSILLVDSGLWSKMRGKEVLLLQLHSPSPTPRDRVVLVSEAGLNALLTRQISVDQALRLGVLSLPQDPDHQLGPHLRQALAPTDADSSKTG